MTNIVDIAIPPDAGAITFGVACPASPQALSGIVWRYTTTQQPDGKCGEITPATPSVPLGSPGTIAGRYFVLEGAVLKLGSDGPIPYQVIVSLRGSNGTAFHQEVPQDGGVGTVDKESSPFQYSFHAV
ncbi:MAG: hypothetical protein ABI035_05010 [Gemmatimonadaceae bacterium]